LLLAPLQVPRTPDRDTTAIATVPIIATLAMVVATLTLATTLRAATIHRSGVGSPTDGDLAGRGGRANILPTIPRDLIDREAAKACRGSAWATHQRGPDWSKCDAVRYGIRPFDRVGRFRERRSGASPPRATSCHHSPGPRCTRYWALRGPWMVRRSDAPVAG
jgi:hypothetical protein